MENKQNTNTETQVTVKMSEEDKTTIEKAAQMIGLGHSSFMRATTLERAKALLKNLS